MTDQQTFGLDDGAPDHERLREHSADFTPSALVRQMFEQFKLRYRSPDPISMVDAGAGAGVFGQQAKLVLGEDLRASVGVEIRDEEQFTRHYTLGVHANFLELEARRFPSANLVVGNVPFHLWREFVVHARGIVGPRGWVIFLGLSSWGQRARDGIELFSEVPPFAQWRIAGPIGFRGPGRNPETGKRWGTDTRCYSWWVWRGASMGEIPSWATTNLPLLPSIERRWTTRPGTMDT